MNTFPKALKRIPIFLGFWFLFTPLLVFAGPTVQILGESTTNPSPGTTMYVTISICDDLNYSNANDIRPQLLAAIVTGSNVTSLASSCATSGQYMVVDADISGNIASGPGMYDQTANVAGASGANVYPTYSEPGLGGCPANGTVTAIWPIYIDASSLNSGNYSFVVETAEDYITCGNSPSSSAAFNFSIPLPPPGSTITKTAEAATTAPNGLVLFDINYTFVNTTSFTVTDTVPPNTTFVSMSPGGSNSAGNLTWNIYNGAAGGQQSGAVWFLARVNSGVANGTVITNTATGAAAGAANSTGSAFTTVTVPQLTLTKTESSTSVVAGASVTYNLDWTSTGQNLQTFDSYDNIAAGTNTTGNAVPWGYDGTDYTVVPGPGPGTSLGTWTVRTDPTGNNYIEADSPYNSTGTGGNYPEMIRNVPGGDICDANYMVEGDMEIPVTAPGVSSGADAHMVIACDPSQGITLKAGLSLDAFPGNLFVQKNNIYPLQSPSASMVITTPFTVQAGQWYTLQALVHSNGSGTIFFTIHLWPKGSPAKMVTLNYTDTFAPQPTCSGGWTAGWQADETAGTDWYSNLKVFGPGPVVNASVTDVIPAGITYQGSSVTPFSTAPLIWNSPGSFPTTMFSFDTPINWWGQVACPGPITNQFTMAGDSIAAVTSNTVSLNVTGSCNTPTITATPTQTTSPTVTPTITDTPGPTADIFYVSKNLFTSSDPVSIHVEYSYYPGPYSLMVYNTAGELVKKIVPPQTADSYITLSTTWDGTNDHGEPCASGVYILYLIEPYHVQLKKVVLIHQ